MVFMRDYKEILNFANITIDFSDECKHESTLTVIIPARTKELVTVPLKSTKLREGYIDQIQTGPGIFAGQYLVTQIANSKKNFSSIQLQKISI